MCRRDMVKRSSGQAVKKKACVICVYYCPTKVSTGIMQGVSRQRRRLFSNRKVRAPVKPEEISGTVTRCLHKKKPHYFRAELKRLMMRTVIIPSSFSVIMSSLSCNSHIKVHALRMCLVWIIIHMYSPKRCQAVFYNNWAKQTATTVGLTLSPRLNH
ncbi:hypothetical protein BDB00DRAFT_829435 [Zychaea mexicana]|uniref:uncharacterized protein n=1 Tax=Zychaea mexicana TaxID=64656 RepID=UPI0022FF2F17|nr:uncharacterized protein BDB00DRAFT_829435 [Zychaea mexicana]KAI9492165.1 hypothetical protein BDB00DRAFT_829435 [Zychaea mexicana]